MMKIERPASLDRLTAKKSKKAIWLEERLREILYCKTLPLPPIKVR